MQPKVDYNGTKFAVEISLAVLSFSPDRKALSELVIHSVSCYNSVFKHDFALWKYYITHIFQKLIIYATPSPKAGLIKWKLGCNFLSFFSHCMSLSFHCTSLVSNLLQSNNGPVSAPSRLRAIKSREHGLVFLPKVVRTSFPRSPPRELAHASCPVRSSAPVAYSKSLAYICRPRGPAQVICLRLSATQPVVCPCSAMVSRRLCDYTGRLSVCAPSSVLVLIV